MNSRSTKTTKEVPAVEIPDMSAVLVEIPFVREVEMASGMRLDVNLSRTESEVFHGIGHALVRDGVRLKDGSPIEYDRAFRTRVLRYLLEQVRLAAED